MMPTCMSVKQASMSEYLFCMSYYRLSVWAALYSPTAVQL